MRLRSSFARAGTATSLLLALPGCRQDAQVSPSPSPAAAASSSPGPAAPPAAAKPSLLSRRASFPVAAIRPTIEDMAMSSRLDGVLAGTNGALAVNGGFFAVDGSPLGLAVSDGRALSRFSREMSGGVLWIRDGVAHLSASEEYQAGTPEFAVQCRPRLVVGSRVNIRSDDGRRARRTAICLRDSGRTIEFVAATGAAGDPGPTLLALATELAEDGCEEALNLDGGPSTAWAFRGDGGIAYEAPLAPIRQAIVVRERRSP